MAFETNEISLEDSSRVQLIKFAVGSDTFNYISTKEDTTIDGTLYTAVGFKLSQNSLEMEDRGKTILLTLPADDDFVARYLSVLPGILSTITVLEYQRRDVAEETIIAFKGLVQSVGFTKNATEAKVALLPLQGLASRTGPRATYQNLCGHLLGDVRCQVDTSLFTYTGTASAFDSDTNIVTVDGIFTANGAGWATGGYLTNDTLDDYRMIIAQSGDDLTLHFAFSDDFPLLTGDVDVVAGCDRSLATCKTKFDNVVNYGGFAFVPNKNIFSVGL